MGEVAVSPRTALAWLVPALALAFAGCKEPESSVRHEPMRRPPGDTSSASEPPPALSATSGVSETGAGAGPSADDEEPPPLPERPPADPAIERAIDLIASSDLTFLDPPAEDEEDGEPTVYTAEQFASMLRTKWDWIGYDIVELEPWLDEIACRSFKTNLPYLVRVEGQAEPVEVRTWLAPQLRSPD